MRLNTISMPMPTSSETTAIGTIGGQPLAGASSRSKTRRRAAFRNAMASQPPSGDVAEAAQALLDLFLAGGAVQLGQLLLQRVGDELLDRRVAGDVGVPLHPGHEVLVELHGFGVSEHHVLLPTISGPGLAAGRRRELLHPELRED